VKKYVPLRTEPEVERTFSTYSNYLQHMDRCLADEYGVGESFIPSAISVLRGMPKVTRIGRRRPTDDDVKRIGNSWHGRRSSSSASQGHSMRTERRR
jgi:hypothetical protein